MHTGIAHHLWLLAFRLAMLATIALIHAPKSLAMEQTSEAGLARIRQAAKRIEPLHEKKIPPGPRDWLAQHAEAGQSFDQYLRSSPNRPTAEHTRLYLQPIGEFSENQRRLVEATADLLSRFYNLPVKLLDPLSLDLIPADARRTHPAWGDKQILTTYVLEKGAQAAPPERRRGDARVDDV